MTQTSKRKIAVIVSAIIITVVVSAVGALILVNLNSANQKGATVY